MWGYVIAVLMIALAVVLLARNIMRTLRGQSGCGSCRGGSCCSSSLRNDKSGCGDDS